MIENQEVLSDSSRSALEDPDFTPKQEAFINAFIELRNGTRAAIKAGYSRVGAPSEASRLLSNPKVKAEIHKRILSIGWTKEKVLLEVNDGYEAAKSSADLKERREFIQMMAKLMGYLHTEQGLTINLGLIGHLPNIIGRFSERVQGAFERPITKTLSDSSKVITVDTKGLTERPNTSEIIQHQPLPVECQNESTAPQEGDHPLPGPI